MNVTLIGMSGAGKSYVGRLLAERKGFEFLDTDDLLEKNYGKSIQELLDEIGSEKYLDAEAETVISATSGRDGLIVSPGGSIIYRPAAVAHAKAMSKVVYLSVPFEIIEQRAQGRPPHAVIGLGEKSLRQLYEERAPMYERVADLIVDTHALDLEGVLVCIEDFLHLPAVRQA